MDARLWKIALVLMIALGGQVCPGASTPWPDEVVSFDQPDGSSTTGGPPSAALGPADGSFVSIDTPEQLILAFTDNRVFDGEGDDLWIVEATDCGATVNVFGRSFDGPCTFLGTITNSAGIDLADHPGLENLDFIRLVGLDDSGQFEGYDLDAVIALNSVDREPPPCPIPAPGAILLSSLGAGLIAWLRRRSML